MGKHIKNLIKSESGYASFVITLVTMIVVSLIVIAFAADSRLEQKDSLESNLSTQAYYAAESGINDAIAVIQKNTGSTLLSTSDTCAQPGGAYINSANSNKLLPSNNVKYSCLIVDPDPTSLNYTNVVQPGEGLVIELDNYSGKDISKINFSWQDSNEASPISFQSCPGVPKIPAAPTLPAYLPASEASNAAYSTYSRLSEANCDAGLLQVDLVSNTDLTTGTGAYTMPTTYFLQPIDSSDYAYFRTVPGIYNDYIEYTKCKIPYTTYYACSTTNTSSFATNGVPIMINNPDSNIYYLHIQSFYAPEDIYITATDTKGNTVHFTNAQVLIDSTGEANGQYKRLQERLCVGSYCNQGITGGDVVSNQCIDKQFGVYPAGGYTYASPASGCSP